MLTQEGELISDLVSAIDQRTQARAFVVAGPPGTGKSHLCRNAAVSEALRAAVGSAESIAYVDAPYQLIEEATSSRVLNARVVFLDNFDICVNVFAELEISAIFPKLFQVLSERRAVLVIAQRSAVIWKEISRSIPSVVLLRVRQPTQLTLARSHVPNNKEVDGPASSWRAFAAAALYDEGTAKMIKASWTVNATAGGQRTSEVRCASLPLLLERHGCTAAFEEVRRIIKMHSSGSADRRGPVAATLPVSTGVLLHGEPGTGKSLLVSLLQADLPQVPFFVTTGPEYFSKYLGDSEQRLRERFELAKSKAPSVLVIEDIDAIAATRGKTTADAGDEGGGSASVTRRILASLLCEMDGVGGNAGVLVVGTTSRIEEIDPAVLRQGRLETHVQMKRLSEKDAQVAAVAWLQGFTFSTDAERCAAADALATWLVDQPSATFEMCVRRLTEHMLDEGLEICTPELLRSVL